MMVGNSRCGSCRPTPPCCVVRVMSSPDSYRGRSCPQRHFPWRRQKGQVKSQGRWAESCPRPQGKASPGPGEQCGRKGIHQIPLPRLPRSRWGSLKA